MVGDSSQKSFFPNVNVREQQKQLEKLQETLTRHAGSPWIVMPTDMERYLKMFDYFDQNKSGKLEKHQALAAFQQTGLAKELLEYVWTMVDSEDRGQFDKSMFVTSIHLLSKIS